MIPKIPEFCLHCMGGGCMDCPEMESVHIKSVYFKSGWGDTYYRLRIFINGRVFANSDISRMRLNNIEQYNKSLDYLVKAFETIIYSLTGMDWRDRQSPARWCIDNGIKLSYENDEMTDLTAFENARF